MKQTLTIISFILALNSFSQEKSIDLPIIGFSSGGDRLINVNENLLLFYSTEESSNFFFYDSQLNLKWEKDVSGVDDIMVKGNAIFSGDSYAYDPVKLKKFNSENGEILKEIEVYESRPSEGSILSDAVNKYKNYYSLNQDANIISVVSIPQAPGLDKNWIKWYNKKNVVFEIVVWNFDLELNEVSKYIFPFESVESIKWEIKGKPVIDNSGNTYFSMWSELGELTHYKIDLEGELTTIKSNLITQKNEENKPVYISDYDQKIIDGRYTLFYKTQATMFLEYGKYSDFGNVGKDFNISLEKHTVDFEGEKVDRVTVKRFSSTYMNENNWKTDYEIELRNVLSYQENEYFLTELEDVKIKFRETHTGDYYTKSKYLFYDLVLYDSQGKLNVKIPKSSTDLEELSKYYCWMQVEKGKLYVCNNDTDTGVKLSIINIQSGTIETIDIISEKKSEWMITQYYNEVAGDKFYYVLTSRKTGASKLQMLSLTK